MRPIDYFDTAVESNRQRTAIVDGTFRVSFDDLSTMTHRIAQHPGIGFAPQTQDYRVAILSPNDHRVISCTLGVMRGGGAIIPLHQGAAVAEHVAVLSATQPAVVLYHSTNEAVCRELCRHVIGIRWVTLESVCSDEDGGDCGGPRQKCAADWGEPTGNPQRPVYLWQTSGTSGAAKIVVDTCSTFDASLKVLRQVLREQYADDPKCLVVAPLSHAAWPHAFAMLSVGATIVIMSSFDAGKVLTAIEQHSITHMWLPPTALRLLVREAQSTRTNLSSIRSVFIGGSGVAPELLRDAVGVFGPVVAQSYSQIESGFLTYLSPRDCARSVAGHRPERLRSSGTSLFVARVVAMDEGGRFCDQNGVGEIVVRGSSVKRYLDDAATACAREHGWHHTGDLGYFDEDGFLFVVGRKKDVIITSGFKVSAAEVESVILKCANVVSCAVVPIADDVRGENVAAVVCVSEGAEFDPVSIRNRCRQELGPAKVPRVLVSWPDLPMSATGKVNKIEIRQRLERH